MGQLAQSHQSMLARTALPVANIQRWRRRLDLEAPAGAVEVVVVIVVAEEDVAVASKESAVVNAELSGR